MNTKSLEVIQCCQYCGLKCHRKPGAYLKKKDKDTNNKQFSHTNKAHIYALNTDAEICTQK